jgi:hypothetical protein
VPELFDDIATLRPTVFPSVPRLFNRLYDKVLSTSFLGTPTWDLISDSFLFSSLLFSSFLFSSFRFDRTRVQVMAQRATLTGVKKMLFERAWAAKVQLLK